MSDPTHQAPSPEHLAELLPQYGIESFIAQGGMGAVYKGCQLSLDRDVAIKVLLYEFGEDTEFRESFTTEAKAMARLNHPNLLGVFDYGNVDGMPYIVMEYVKGGSLHEAAWNKVVDPAQAVAIVKGICAGLAHAHEHDIVHRDIKPSNILLTTKAEPKVADFGLAHATDSEKSGLVMGTPGYTAPEVFKNPDQAGKLADIYSVGVILHQLLSGIDPAGCTEPPSKVTGYPQLDAIWRKATHITPALRYPSVAAMLTELGNWAPAAKPKVPVVTAAVPLRPLAPKGASNARVTPRAKAKTDGGVVKFFMIGILAVLGFLTYEHLQKPEPVSKGSRVENKVPFPPEPPDPVIPPPPHPPKQEGHYTPNPEPTETVTHTEPVTPPVVDSHPDPVSENTHDLPPGDPELLQRATGLILDSRKKRDTGYSDNVNALLFQFASHAHTGKKEDAVFMENLRRMLVGNRVPSTDGFQGLTDEVVKNFALAQSKEKSIEDAHRNDLTRLRDAYATRLNGIAADTTDAGLKKRLLAQAEQAKDLDDWVQLLAPEPKYVRNSLNAGFVGKWAVQMAEHKEQWIVHPDGKLEVLRHDQGVTWRLLDDGTIEITWPGKKPCSFTRDGDGWTGLNTNGKNTTLTRGNW